MKHFLQKLGQIKFHQITLQSFDLFIVTLVLLVLTSCDPMSQYIIKAKSNDIKIEVYPSIENIYCRNVVTNDICLRAKQMKVKELNSGSSYIVKSNNNIEIYGKIGYKVDTLKFPYDSIVIIYSDKKLFLNSKKEILESFKEEKHFGRKVFSMEF